MCVASSGRDLKIESVYRGEVLDLTPPPSPPPIRPKYLEIPTRNCTEIPTPDELLGDSNARQTIGRFQRRMNYQGIPTPDKLWGDITVHRFRKVKRHNHW